MNSDENKPVNQLFENSGAAIKRDLRAGFEYLGALGIVNQNIERLERERHVGANVSIGYITEEATVREPVVTFDWPLEGSQSFTATWELVGLTNHPKSQRAGAGGGWRAMLALGLALAACGRSVNDVVVIGAGGTIRRAGHFDYTAFEECSLFDKDLSAHPGERHRQLSRKLTSPRSRAGKAARWQS